MWALLRRFPGVPEGGFTKAFVELTVSMLEKEPQNRVSLEGIQGNSWSCSGASRESCAEYVRWALTDPA
eukprot:m.219034 g.219034  ORF g.219034 m.219034 type:complete len:69 (-) comp25735_c0_seq2:83-289(-)